MESGGVDIATSDVVGNSNSARLLTSQNNEYPEYNEGNTQANNGKCIFRLSWSSTWSSQRISAVLASGTTIVKVPQGSLNFGTGFYVH